MEPAVILPEPIPIDNPKIARIIDGVLSKKKEEVLAWTGSQYLAELIYFYLFKKYRHNCLFSLYIMGKDRPSGYVEPPEAPIEVEEPLPPVQTFEQSGGGQGQIGNAFGDLTPQNHYTKAAEEFMRCYKQGMELIVCPLFLETMTGAFGGLKHANLLIFKRATNTFEVFEPYGYAVDEGKEWRNRAVANFVKTINSKYLTYFTYETVLMSCPVFGLQLIEETLLEKYPKEIQESGGYCAIWCLFFTELVLTNPELSQRQIARLIFRGEPGEVYLDIGRREDIGMQLREIIRGYVYLIYEVLDNYFSFIFMNNSAKTIIEETIIKDRDRAEELIKAYLAIEKELLITGKSIEEWSEMIDLTQEDNYFILRDYGHDVMIPPYVLRRLIDQMKGRDIFADLIQSEQSGGGIKRRKNRFNSKHYRRTKKYKRTNKRRKTIRYK